MTRLSQATFKLSLRLPGEAFRSRSGSRITHRWQMFDPLAGFSTGKSWKESRQRKRCSKNRSARYQSRNRNAGLQKWRTPLKAERPSEDGITRHEYRRTQVIAERIARAMWATGLRGEECAGISSHNDARVLFCMLGIMRAGAVWVPINYRNAIDANVEYMNYANTSWL